MIWKGKDQFYREGISMTLVGFFTLFIVYFVTRTSFGAIYAGDLFFLMTFSIIGSLIFVAGLILIIICRMMVREN